MFDGRLVSKPDEKIGKQIGEWLGRGQKPDIEATAETGKIALFNESGNLTGEKETKAMLDAIQKAGYDRAPGLNRPEPAEGTQY